MDSVSESMQRLASVLAGHANRTGSNNVTPRTHTDGWAWCHAGGLLGAVREPESAASDVPAERRDVVSKILNHPVDGRVWGVEFLRQWASTHANATAVCGHCKGSGESVFRCHCGHEHEHACIACDGSGKEELDGGLTVALADVLVQSQTLCEALTWLHQEGVSEVRAAALTLRANERPTLILAGGDHRVAVAPVSGHVPMVHPSAEDVL